MKANGRNFKAPTKNEIAAAYDAAQCVVETHRKLSEWMHVGQTLLEIDQYIAQLHRDMGAKSCFLGYRIPRLPPFPAHACLSLNECVVHGHPMAVTRPIEEGDVLKVDIGVRYRGWIGDAARTYVFGEMNDDVKALTDCGKESIQLGIKEMWAGKQLVNWARTVEQYVEKDCGFHLIRGFGGHGVGRELHLPPFVSNTVPRSSGEWPDAFTPWIPGMIIAVEPMVAVGTGRTHQVAKEWPIFTEDRSQSVHYEHNVLITDSEPRILTEGLDEVPDVILR